jgi:hypothetical protein
MFLNGRPAANFYQFQTLLVLKVFPFFKMFVKEIPSTEKLVSEWLVSISTVFVL